MLHVYRVPGDAEKFLIMRLQQVVGDSITSLKSEYCFNISTAGILSNDNKKKLLWLLTETFEPDQCREDNSFLVPQDNQILLEFGPRMAFSTGKYLYIFMFDDINIYTLIFNK